MKLKINKYEICKSAVFLPRVRPIFHGVKLNNQHQCTVLTLPLCQKFSGTIDIFVVICFHVLRLFTLTASDTVNHAHESFNKTLRMGSR